MAWSRKLLVDSDYDVRLFKLHGSIDWVQDYPVPYPKDEYPNDADATDLAREYVSHRRPLYERDPSDIGEIAPPNIFSEIVGLMNFGTRKELLYASAPFTTLFSEFIDNLDNASLCVIAGYSFRDKLVNTIIEDAVSSRLGHLKLLIVNPSIDQLLSSNPILRALNEYGVLDSIDQPFEEAVLNGTLKSRCKELLAEGILDIPRVQMSQVSESKERDPNQIRIVAQRLGDTFDICNFCLRRCSTTIRKLSPANCSKSCESICDSLKPFMRNVRELCFKVRWLYEELRFGGTYGGEYLSDINVNPELISATPLYDQFNKELDTMQHAFSLAYGACHNVLEEFRDGVIDPEYGSSAPSNFAMAELAIRKPVRLIYELVECVNDLYVSGGYEEPFGKIVAHRRLLRDERPT